MLSYGIISLVVFWVLSKPVVGHWWQAYRTKLKNFTGATIAGLLGLDNYI